MRENHRAPNLAVLGSSFGYDGIAEVVQPDTEPSLTAENASLPVGARRLAAAAATLAVLTAAAAGGDSLAQSPNVAPPATLVPIPSAPALPQAPTLPSAPAPSLPPTPKPPPIPEPPPTPKPAPAPRAPVAPPSPPDKPSLPRIDGGGVVRDRAGAVGQGGGNPAGRSLPTLGSPDPTAVSRSGNALPSTSGPNVTEDALARAGLVAASFPSRSELAKLPPAERRDLIRRAFDAPLRERRLRQLRRTIRQYSGCMRALSQRGRSVLELRAGLFGRDPASRRSIGRRIGASPRTVMRLERSSLRRLIEAGESGLCVGGSAAAAFGETAEGSDPSESARSDRGGGSGGVNAGSPTGDVLADASSGGPTPLLDLGDGDEGPAETLLFFLLALLAVLGPLAVIAIASRRRANVAGAPTHSDPRQRPLLFLDVDGVIVIDPRSDGAPPGRIATSPLGLSYVPDRAGALIRELASRFDLVWATGWGHHANVGLTDRLGLPEHLPVVTFGRNVRFGSSKWKIKAVREYAGNRPAAWLDDNFVARHEHWAAYRSAPTLLVRVDSRVGLTPEQVRRLTQWADDLAQSQAARPNADRRLRAG